MQISYWSVPFSFLQILKVVLISSSFSNIQFRLPLNNAHDLNNHGGKYIQDAKDDSDTMEVDPWNICTPTKSAPSARL